MWRPTVIHLFFYKFLYNTFLYSYFSIIILYNWRFAVCRFCDDDEEEEKDEAQNWE